MSPFRSFSPFRPTNFSPLSGGNVDFATFIQGQGKAWYGNNTHSLSFLSQRLSAHMLDFPSPTPKISSLAICTAGLPPNSRLSCSGSGLPAIRFLPLLWFSYLLHLLRPEFFRCPFLNGFSAWRAASSARRASSHLWIQMPWLRTICSIFSSLLVSSFLSSSIRDLAQLVFPLFVFPHAIVPSLSHVPDQQTKVLKVA